MRVSNGPYKQRPQIYTARANVSLTADQREWLERYCAKRGMTMSEFVRAAIRRQQDLQQEQI